MGKDDAAKAYTDALRLVASRELTSAQLHRRLLHRGHSVQEIAAAIGRLREEGTLDDDRAAAAMARTAAAVKGRGRDRILRELTAAGVDRDVARRAVAVAYGEVDEGALLERAIARFDRRAANRRGPNALRQFLFRQGFSADAIAAVLRQRGADQDE
jgi:regulatory protein